MLDTNSSQPKYAVCCVPVSPMRREPAHRSEMVSQQLFGECSMIIEEAEGRWVKIKGRYDEYEGWCQDSHVTAIEQTAYETSSIFLTADWVNEILFNGQKMMLPLGCGLPGLEAGMVISDKYKISFHGKLVDMRSIERNEASISKIACQFLNTPYLWGGKSVFGIDCSGFTQTVYKFLGIPLLRDAYQQASQGSVIGFLQEAKCGDLAFFDNAEGKIVHVGIMLNDHEIIHSSGKVRIDKIDSQGIMNQDSFTRTHQLRIIKRYF